MLIHTITEAEVNEAYIEHLLHLKKKLNSADSELAEAVVVAGGVTVRPLLENLKIKAVEKARAFLLQKIYSLARWALTRTHTRRTRPLTRTHLQKVSTGWHGRRFDSTSVAVTRTRTSPHTRPHTRPRTRPLSHTRL